MVGKYEIEIYNNKSHYFLTVKRNITVIQGNSGTGKTSLLQMISQYDDFGASSGITVLSDADCHVVSGRSWEEQIKRYQASIIFIDEINSFVKTDEFARIVKASGNYFVIVSRDGLPNLPYSIEEIYGLKTASNTGKYKAFSKVYNEMYHIYHLEGMKYSRLEAVITEDSNAGYEFFYSVFGEKCISAHGKSNVYSKFVESDGAVLAIVDGAAFGSEIGNVMRYIESNKKDCVIYAPESFEYLILCAGLFDIPKDVLEKTYDHADSAEYMSWEQFYTKYLTDVTKGTVYQYSKGNLNKSYLTKGTVDRILEVLPEMVRECGERHMHGRK